MKTRNVILWTVAIAILLLVNYQTYQRELLAVNGRVVLLELAPVDPRSLMQGDYMRLRYALAKEIEDHTDLERGKVVVRIDSNNVAHFVKIYDSVTPLHEDEILLPFRQDYDVYIGPESYFFQEGHAEYYEDAEYGEFRISASGSILLVGLRDAKFNPLSPLK
jgi:uncharacterized membrane-anchored protein